MQKAKERQTKSSQLANLLTQMCHCGIRESRMWFSPHPLETHSLNKINTSN